MLCRVVPRRSQAGSLVARPASVEDVSAIMAICHEAALPVVPQGGNTGLCAAAVPQDERAILLNLGRMNRLRDVGNRFRAPELANAFRFWGEEFPGPGNFRKTVGIVGASRLGRMALLSPSALFLTTD